MGLFLALVHNLNNLLLEQSGLVFLKELTGNRILHLFLASPQSQCVFPGFRFKYHLLSPPQAIPCENGKHVCQRFSEISC